MTQEQKEIIEKYNKQVEFMDAEGLWGGETGTLADLFEELAKTIEK